MFEKNKNKKTKTLRVEILCSRRLSKEDMQYLMVGLHELLVPIHLFSLYSPNK